MFNFPLIEITIDKSILDKSEKISFDLFSINILKSLSERTLNPKLSLLIILKDDFKKLFDEYISLKIKDELHLNNISTKLISCKNCKSEFILENLIEKERKIKFCPYCGKEL